MHLDIAVVLTQIIAFLFTVWVLKRYAWKPLFNLMEERRQKIEDDFKFIEEQKGDIQKQIDAYHEKLKHIEMLARVKIEDAVNEGHKIARNIQNTAQNDAKALLHRAQEEIAKEISKAKMQLKNDVVKIAMAAAQKMIDGNMNEDVQKKLMDDFTDQVKL